MNDPISAQNQTVATDKARLMIYLEPDYKRLLEQLAEVHSRSMSNFVEVLIKEAVDKAVRDGIISKGSEEE
jgi:uncharacterized protein (DUF1778 family)